MPRPVLFAIGQSATIAYLAPVWRRWLAKGGGANWRVIASPAAAQRIRAEAGLEGMPAVTLDSDDAAEFLAALDGWQPECVVMSASYAPMEQAAIAFARGRALPLARIVDTWYGYRRRLLDPAGELDLPDRLLVIDSAAAQEAIREGIPAAILRVVGQPAWEDVPLLPPGDCRDILFVSQPIQRFYGDSLGYTERSVWQMFLSTLRSSPSLARHIYYSAHPDDDMPTPREADVTVVRSGVATLPLVGSVVGMFSSLLVDALLSGRNVISFQPVTDEQRLLAVSPDGLIPRITNAAQLADSLSAPNKANGDVLRNAISGSTDRVEAFCLEFGSGKG